MARREPLIPSPHPGMHPNVEMFDYLRWDAVGNSDLNNLARSPAYANDMRTLFTDNGPSHVFGIAVHARILEPHRYDQIVGILPDGLNLKTKAGRAERDAMSETHEVVITRETADEVEKAAAAVFSHKAASVLVSAAGPVEQSVVVRDPVTGTAIKIRPDKLIPEKGVVVDVKTTRMVSERGFARQSFNLGYDRKLSFYLYAMNQLAQLGPAPEYTTGAILLVQNTPPYEPLVVVYKQRVLDAATVSWRRDLNRFAECQDAGVWPGFTETVEVLDYEDWMISSRESGEEEAAWATT